MLESQYFKRIANIIINNIEVTYETLEVSTSKPDTASLKSLSIDEIERIEKDTIDELISKLGFNEALRRLYVLQEKIDNIRTKETIGLIMLFKQALTNFINKLKWYYEIVLYPIVFKWLLKMQNNSFDKASFLIDFTPNIERDIDVLCIEYNEVLMQETLFDVESKMVPIPDVSAMNFLGNTREASVINNINMLLSKHEIIVYGKRLVDTLIERGTSADKVTIKIVVDILDNIYSSRTRHDRILPKKKNKKGNLKLARKRIKDSQIKLDGF